jgi:RHS repeat-associated protein
MPSLPQGGIVVSSTRYDVFGNLQGTPTLETNYLYTGQQYDAISELYSLRARYYDPSYGRFLSRDTWAYDYQNPVELNRYVYVANNPATWTDPSGYSAFGDFAANIKSKIAAIPAVQAFSYHLTNAYVQIILKLGNIPLGVCIISELGLGYFGIDVPLTDFGCGAFNPTFFGEDFGNSPPRNNAPDADTPTSSHPLYEEADVPDINNAGNQGTKNLSQDALPDCFNSFSADTEVSTPHGDIPIAEIDIGDTVLAYNELTGTIGEYEVTHTISHTDEVIIHLYISGELIETTPEHPFYTGDGEWIDAEDLEVGEEILSLVGDYGIVEKVVVIEDANRPMYNLTVAEAHTFFVGDGDWLVHNCDNVEVPEGSYYPNQARQVRDSVDLDNWTVGPEKRNVGLGKNVSVAEYDIVGGNMAQDHGQVFSVSGGEGFDLKVSNMNVDGYIPNTPSEKHILKTLQPGMRGWEGGRNASRDSEAKILEWFAQQLNQNSSGTIILYTENPPCRSCGGPNRYHEDGIFGQFRDLFPNIDIRVLYGGT